MTKHQIVTSPDLIKLLGEKLYNNRLDVILVRELIQNAVDASRGKGTPVNLVVIPKDCMTTWRGKVGYRSLTVSVDDTGVGMTKQILTDVFLSIGSSYKPGDEETTGGFGIAKVALFSAKTWSVEISGGRIDQDLTYRKSAKRIGVNVKAHMEFGDTNTNYENKMWAMIYGNNVDNLRLNGEVVPAYKATGRINRYETDSGIPFTIRTAPALYLPVADHYLTEYAPEDEDDAEPGDTRIVGAIIYRINGLVQFVVGSGVDGLSDAGKNLIVDFENIGYKPVDKDYPFSMSRESVHWAVNDPVQKMVARFAKDTMSAVKNEEDADKQIWHRNPRTGLWAHSSDGKRFNPEQSDRDVAAVWQKVFEVIRPGWIVGEDVEFAVSNDDDVVAFRIGGEGVPDCTAERIYGINPVLFRNRAYDAILSGNYDAVALIAWHLACHELAHEDFNAHDEKFTSQEGFIAAGSALAFAEGMAHVKYVVRRMVKRIIG